MAPKHRSTLLAIFVALLLAPFPTAATQDDNASPADSAGAEFPPTQLNNITLGQRVHWAALQFIAPERLSAIVPVYIYSDRIWTVEDYDEHALPPCLPLADDETRSPGTICAYGEAFIPGDGDSGFQPQLYWNLGNQTSGTADKEADGNSLALNHRVPGVNPDETLWMNYEDWNAAVDHYKAVCPAC